MSVAFLWMAPLFIFRAPWAGVPVLSCAVLVACSRGDSEPTSQVRASLAAVTSTPPVTVPAPRFLPTTTRSDSAPFVAPPGMVWIGGAEFSMGSADPTTGGHCHEPMDDARPIHRVSVSGFFVDATEVTNASFAEFVERTGYVTDAERKPSAEELPGVPAEARVAGSIVFTKPSSQVPLDQPARWWRFVPGANWRHPAGPDSTLAGLEHHPVVHVTYADALAYARWAKKDLPTEAEWELAARGGLSGATYPWGDELTPHGEARANTYQGSFPIEDTAQDGYAGTAPVASYAPNAFGLYDVAGNVWEWTLDWYRADTYAHDAKLGALHDPVGPAQSFDPSEPQTPKRVQRGGSFLCTNQYCTRYMVGTRGKGEPSSSSNHIGFRCVLRPAREARKQ